MINKIQKILIFSILILLTSFIYDKVITFNLGKKTCKLSITGKGDESAKFISLHENEISSVQAFLKISPSLLNCKLYQLQQDGQRRIKYELNGKSYEFDPNRIFSAVGIKATLKNCNKNYPVEMEKLVKLFSDSLLSSMKIINTNDYIFAIHNNTNNAFSALSYKNSKDADEVYVNNEEDIDNFFIVTSKTDFNYFKTKQRNVVLQSASAADDGSLSIYCQKNKLHYINIEAEQGQTSIQVKMIQEAYSLIKK